MFDLLEKLNDKIEGNESDLVINQHKRQYEKIYFDNSQDLTGKLINRISQINKLLQTHKPPVIRSKSIDEYERYLKSKRLHRNMFTSGLQGVWGIPGKK